VKKRMRIMLMFTGALFGAILVYKIFSTILFHFMMSHQKNIAVVSTAKAQMLPWPQELQAVGSIRAIQGVDVTTELAGIVDTIYFAPGSTVTQNTLLVQLRAATDIATLHALQANAALAVITLKRDLALLPENAVSKATRDADAANLQNLQSQVDAQAATVNKKSIRAPFTGRLGISLVNPGQFLNPGDKIVNLQQLDPLYVDFYVPQQSFSRLQKGQTVSVVSDAFPDESFEGTLTTLNPALDAATRNLTAEATIQNPGAKLAPGMFATVTVTLGPPEKFLTVPARAVSFNSYGSVIYTVDRSDKKNLAAKQVIVTTGEEHDDQIQILKGLSENDEIVTEGQLKLKNGSSIQVKNTSPEG